MRKLALFSAGFAAAAAAYVYLNPGSWVLLLAAALLLGAFLLQKGQLLRVSLAVLGISAGLLWCFAYDQLLLAPVRTLAGEDRAVEVQLLSQPQQTRTGAAARVQLEADGHPVRAMLYADRGLLDRQPGDWISCTADIALSGSRIRQGESLYHLSNGNPLVLSTRETTFLRAEPPSRPMALRLWLQRRIDRLYDGQTGAFLQALLTGDRTGLTFQTRSDFSVTGVSHMIAVSGMHLLMLVTMVSFLCLHNPRMTALIGCPVSVLFALMTGAGPSVCRAAVMQILLLCAPVVRREYDPATTLGTAVLVLLVQNPWSIASVSLQLSFGAVAGLLLFSGRICKKLLSCRKKPGRLWRFLSRTVAATTSATALTLPLVFLYFGQISLMAPLTNVLVLGVVTLIFNLGLLSLLPGPVGRLLAWPVRWMCSYVLGVCRALASFPYAAAYPENPAMLLWAAAASLLLFFWLLSKRKQVRLWLVSCLTAALLGSLVFGSWQLSNTFTVLDVGQGQCLVYRCGSYTAVVDCGGSYAEGSARNAARLLRSAGVTQVDALILTHFDYDHVGGVPYLLDLVEVSHAYFPDAESSNRIAALLRASVPCTVVRELHEIDFPSGGMTIFPPVSRENSNDSGLSVLARLAEYDILITGDMDQYAEMRLLSKWNLQPVDLLVAGHHGSDSSTGQVLLDWVRPKTAVISVERDSPYGHPAPAVLERLEQIGAEVHRTDLEGTIRIRPTSK